MKRSLTLLCAMLCLTSACAASPAPRLATQPESSFDRPPQILSRQGNGDAASPTPDIEVAHAALMYINHLNYLVATLNDFDDLLALSQTYENLTDNNLNLEVLKDEATVQVITQLMDAITEMEKSNVKLLSAKAALEREKRDALLRAIPSPSLILVGTNPALLAITAACAVTSSVQNYYAAKAAAGGDYTQKLDTHAQEMLAYINELNKELFFSQWRLVQKYGLRDGDRITRDEIALFLGFTKLLDSHDPTADPNETIWEIFKNNEDVMRNLPFYWVTRASAAAQLMTDEKVAEYENYRNDLRLSCQHYFDLIRKAPIIRKDPTACTMALLRVGLFPKPEREEDKQCVRAWLEFITKNTRLPDWQTKFMVAKHYATLLDDREAALALVRKTLTEVAACLTIWERSDKKTNIFYATPSFQKAMKYSQEELKKQLPNWECEVEEVLPSLGWYWLKDAGLAILEQTNAGAVGDWGSDFPSPNETTVLEREIFDILSNLAKGEQTPSNPWNRARLCPFNLKKERAGWGSNDQKFSIEKTKDELIINEVTVVDGDDNRQQLPRSNGIFEIPKSVEAPKEIHIVATAKASGFKLCYVFTCKDATDPTLTRLLLTTAWRTEPKTLWEAGR